MRAAQVSAPLGRRRSRRAPWRFRHGSRCTCLRTLATRASGGRALPESAHQDKKGALAISPTIVILIGKHGVFHSSLILSPDVDFPVGIVSEAQTHLTTRVPLRPSLTHTHTYTQTPSPPTSRSKSLSSFPVFLPSTSLSLSSCPVLLPFSSKNSAMVSETGDSFCHTDLRMVIRSPFDALDPSLE